MLTPVFECSQEGGFILVRLFLSAICKVMDAAFDINDNQFTFYCSPYYLRLRFDQCLQEGKGERATYDLEHNVLTVYLPKANAAETFTRLDNPAYLIATEKQRAELIRVLGGSDAAAAPDGEEIEETEYVQTLQGAGADDEQREHPHRHDQQRRGLDVLSSEESAECGYGFANGFSGLFSRLDPDVVREVVSLPANPERTPHHERRRLRLEAETKDFDEDALLLAYEDAEGEIAQVLRYVPAHIADFRRALQETSAGRPVVYASIPDVTTAAAASAATTAGVAPSNPADDALEEEESTLVRGTGGEERVMVWHGNIAEFKKPLIEEIEPTESSSGGVPCVDLRSSAQVSGASLPSPSSPSAAAAAATGEVAPRAPAASSSLQHALQRTRLAVPKVRPVLRFTREENEVLQRVSMPRLLFPPSQAEVEALTVDLLLSEAYDDLVTEGAGCSESLWNLVQLSPALSFLDPADTTYDACVAFARRALIYPIHRHCALLQRVWALVGTRLLLGKHYTLRALLRVRTILSHAEHKHILSTIYLDPLLAYWGHTSDADERLMRLALEIHQHASRTEPVTVAVGQRPGVSVLRTMLETESKKKTLNPLTLLYLGLPLTDDEEEEKGWGDTE